MPGFTASFSPLCLPTLPYWSMKMAGTRVTKEERAASAAAAAAKGEATTAGDAPTKPTPVVKSKFCLNCQKDLTRNIRVTCAECVSATTSLPLIELCVECFGVGIEMGGHKKTHRYTVSDCLAFPLVRERGAVPAPVPPTSDLANGSDAAATGDASTGTASALPVKDKDAAAVLTHDWTADEELLLLEGIEMFGLGNWKDIAEHIGTKSEKKCETHYLKAYLNRSDLLPRFIDELDDPDTVETAAAEADEAKLSSTGPISAAALEVASAAHSDRPSGSELAGYMPLRGDFDVEYENEAELILADMEFSEDDHATERELKLKVIEIYNAKLDERERRKKFVIERGLLDYKKHQQSERRRPKDEREILAQMRPFARFQSPQEHDELVNGLITAMRLRKQILLLQEYRKNGVRSLAEAELYDAEKKKRETEQALQKQRETNSYLYDSGRPASSSRDRASRMSSRGTDGDGTAGAAGEEASARTTRGSSAAHSSTTNASSFDLDGTPGAHLLTPKEKELCVKLKLLPKVSPRSW
jgi:transcriptional adapter 2-alpha